MEDKASLGQRIAKGALWTVLMRASIRLLGIASVFILARLLVPADFGLVAKAVLISGFLEMITQFGFATALIKNQQADKHDYNTVWTLSILRALCIGALLILFSAPLAEFLQEEKLQPVFCCYGLASIIGGFANVGVVDFRKQMQFHLDFRYSLYLKLSSFVTTITIALLWQSYWAFPLGVLAKSLVSVLVSFRLAPFRPRLELSRWRALFDFSKWMLSYELMAAFSAKLDTFILSRFSNAQTLGLYTVAYEVSGTPSTEIAQPVARASLPGLSKLNDQPAKFRQMYADILSNTLVLALPAGIGVAMLAEPITAVLLGDKWLDAAPFMAILALCGITRVISANSVSALVAFGRVDLLTKLSSSVFAIRLLLLPLGFYLGDVIGLCLAVLCAGGIYGVINLAVQHRVGAISLPVLGRQCWRLCLASAIMFLGLNAFIRSADWLQQHPMGLVLFCQVAVGALIFGASLLLLWQLSNRGAGPEQQIINLLQSKLSFSK